MTLFPHFIARLGGAPYDLLVQLEIKEISVLLDKQVQLKVQLKEAATKFSDTVYSLISSQEDKKIQNKLLNLKRSIFNLKKLSEGELETAEQLLNAESKELFKEYQRINKSIEEVDEQASVLFHLEMPKIRMKLADTAGMPSLQKGLLLSSQALLNNTEDYRKQDLSRIRKKELKTEESLVKYLTRMTAKTSPFSTFTNLTTSTYGDFKQKPAGLHQEGEQHEMTSHISLNNNLYHYLRGMMLRLPDIYRNFQLRLNPTLTLQDEVYVFLTNNNNVESFQRLPYNPVIELFHEFLTEKKAGISYREMVSEIIEGEYIEAEESDIEDYINQLINFGFIEFNIGVSGIDPFWDKKLIEVLSPVETTSPLIKPIVDAVLSTREYANQYAVSDPAERRRLLVEAHTAFRNMCMKLHEEAGLPADERKPREELEADAARKAAEEKKKETETDKKETEEPEKKEEDDVFTHQHNTFFMFKPEQMFYEDTTSNLQPQVDEAAMTALTAAAPWITSFDQRFEKGNL